MMRFDDALRAWGTPDFEDVLRREIMRLGNDRLPLLRGMSLGNHVTDAPATVMILGVNDLEGRVRIKAGVFFTSIITGCSCADDPTPVSEISEYCELWVDIDKGSAVASIALVEEQPEPV